jgi:hypothetical protein
VGFIPKTALDLDLFCQKLQACTDYAITIHRQSITFAYEYSLIVEFGDGAWHFFNDRHDNFLATRQIFVIIFLLFGAMA